MIRSFIASFLDPSTGLTREVVLDVDAASVLVRLTPPRPRREDGPHHTCADFTDQRAAIVAALTDTERTRRD